jgi:outer membrane biosynthesis protein TonB
MSLAPPSSILQKQQMKMPTSMRYERVQEILSNDPRLKTLLGSKTQPIDSRFGEELHFSKEVIEVTQAIHAQGKDAHKVPKNEVLLIAMRVMKLLPSIANGEPKTASPPPELPPPKAKTVPKPKPTPVKAKPKLPPKKPVAAKTKKAAAKKPARTAPEKSKAAKPAEPKPAEPEPELPESELPPEKQPLRLPSEFDPKKFPHYDVQSSVYSMLLSALTLAVHHEKFPGAEERQKKIEAAMKDYGDTCDALKSQS